MYTSLLLIYFLIREDTNKVLRILSDDIGPRRTFDEVYAYLEAHFHKSNRVQVVVEEFLGMNDQEDGLRSPPRNLRLPESGDPGSNHDNVVGKGKGVGKNSNAFRKGPPLPPISSVVVGPAENLDSFTHSAFRHPVAEQNNDYICEM